MWKSTFEVGMFLGGSTWTGVTLSGRSATEMWIALAVTLASSLPAVWHWADAFIGTGHHPQTD